MEEVIGRFCNTCHLFFKFDKLVKKADCKYGYMPLCIPCKNSKQKNYRESNENECTKLYEKTPKGYIMRTYRNMRSRVSGVQSKKAHLYLGLELLDKDYFYQWSLQNEDFQRLIKQYRDSGYDMKFAPSIDRKDTTKGYTIDNIRWITHSLNSTLGALKQKEKYGT